MGETDHKESSKCVSCRGGKCYRGTGVRIKGRGEGWHAGLVWGEGGPSGKMAFEWRPERNEAYGYSAESGKCLECSSHRALTCACTHSQAHTSMGWNSYPAA